jgi:sterol desaturase/sphingolipid hydroxylase (fatty acid hydroxylase superfamily)
MSADFVITIHGWLEKFSISVLSSLLAPISEKSILYWPYLAASIAVAVLAYALARNRRRATFLNGFRKAYFTKAIWWHASAQADYRYYFVNTLLYPMIVGPLVVTAAWSAGPTSEALSLILGPHPAAAAPTLWLTVLQHRFEWLWQFHKVHHSAEVLTPITSFRLHPVDLFLMHSFPGLLTGLVQGVFDYASGGAIGYLSFFGLHAGIALYNLVGNLRHSHVWVSYGPLNKWLICPAMHQIHHSALPRHFGCNVGYALTIWDRLLGTHYAPESYEEFPMGLGEGNDHEYHGIWAMYWRPVKDFVAYLQGRRGGVGYGDAEGGRDAG